MESGVVQSLLGWLLAAPEALLYLVLGLAAAVENIFPPVPADVVVLFGSVLTVRRGDSLLLTFLAVAVGNVSGALVVYAVGRRYGSVFFEGRWGRILLRPGQLAALAGFYERHGFGVIFVSRFLPMFRAVVPVFAGVAQIPPLRAAVPIALASGLWYGLLVYLGAALGRNWEALMLALDSATRWLWAAAALAAAGVVWWWWRTR